jgi:DNA polymerase III subunit delta
MKFYTAGLAELLQKIQSGKLKSILIHGVNHGFATTIIEQIVRKMNLIVSEYNIKEITANKLLLIANSTNFFKQKELIKITGAKTALNKELQQCITDNKFEHFICFVSDESLPASGIRKFFEAGQEIASIGCYYENENVIAKIILQQCKKHGKTIDEEALFYLKSNLKGDHQIIKSELEKLFCFTHDQSQITKEDVLATLSNDFLASGDEMCIYFAKKEPINYLEEIEKLKEQNKNEVLMIRALGRYFLNIYIVALKIEDGENIDTAIKSLYPPIFFKYLNDFKQIVRKYTSKDAVNCLLYIQQAEIEFKTNPKTFDLFSLYLKVHTT